MSNILYVRNHDFDAVLNLNNITSIQRLRDKIVIHFNHPEEDFTIYDNQEEFHIINVYFEMLIERSLNRKNEHISFQKEDVE